ncbi:MAG TPA: hypothetical protein VLJ14_01065 [Ktedonobacterales bacterium]|nr:hypothetical protein [Ktedonobacterales bacterium]
MRTHICSTCGLVLDRDKNAARNIQWAGQARRGAVRLPAVLEREAPSRSGWGACHYHEDASRDQGKRPRVLITAATLATAGGPAARG